MTQSDLNRQVASATGETVSTIRDLGFVPLTRVPYEREPLALDWDELAEPDSDPARPLDELVVV